MENLIALLPDIMLYLVSGFLFVRIFNFICTKRKANDYQHIIIKSVIVGYILKYIASFIPALTNIYALNVLGFIVLCCIIAFIAARIYKSNWFYKFLRFIGVENTLNDDFWVDIEGDKSVWAEVYCKDTEEYYYGLVCLSENFKDEPKIVLKRYSIYKENSNEPIKDYNTDPAKRIVIDTSKCEVIKLTYSNNSNVVQRELKENKADYERRS